MATVLVPTPLRRLTGGQSKVEVDGADVAALITAIDSQFPGVADKVLDGDGNVKRFINVFVNDDEIRQLQGLSTPVDAGDRVSIVPAMAGGRYFIAPDAVTQGGTCESFESGPTFAAGQGGDPRDVRAGTQAAHGRGRGPDHHRHPRAR